MSVSQAIPPILLERPVTILPRVGPAIAAKLARINITTVNDLLLHWPRAWLDLRSPQPFESIRRDELVVVEGSLRQIHHERRIGKRKSRITALLSDGKGNELPIVWFQQDYLARTLKAGKKLLLVGYARWDWQENRVTLVNPQRESTRGMLSIYPETAGITSRLIRLLIQPLVEQLSIPNPLPDLSPQLNEAVYALHRPQDPKQLACARKRIALDELLFLQYELMLTKQNFKRTRSPIIRVNEKILRKLRDVLPFTLTDGQRRSAWRIVQEMSYGKPLNYLLQGDVGSGKTIVGLFVALTVLDNKQHVSWMAPTQILARQLHDRIQSLLSQLKIQSTLVVAGIQTPNLIQPTLVIGTHALLTRDWQAPFGLIIIDEQHRFGVEQREVLKQKSNGRVPHTLIMTATPIPRSLALSLYGETNVSLLKEKPLHQQPIRSVFLQTQNYASVYRELEKTFISGSQGFIVVPRINASVESQLESIQEVCERYRKQLPSARIEVCHGQLPLKVQQTAVDAFLKGEIHFLVATSIVEVGIDVPNATLIVIEYAEQFGLAQLHQLRGRVGRGKNASTCIVISSNAVASERLEAFVRIEDGFALAELDLKLRGPGDLLGIDQAGLPPLRLASLTDTLKMEQARVIAKKWLEDPPQELEAWRAWHRREGEKSAD
ncbi:ATP-dependent DNA helicase RecG [Candidatus Berkelbacteria bacterium]|nr:ATP-dependent DNA helicase RecG [Candidatus Berkelbacteria bacterium]